MIAHMAVIKLYRPEYDSQANTLRYNIVAENGTSIDGPPGEFGQSTLVIDDDPHLPLSGSVMLVAPYRTYLQFLLPSRR